MMTSAVQIIFESFDQDPLKLAVRNVPFKNSSIDIGSPVKAQ